MILSRGVQLLKRLSGPKIQPITNHVRHSGGGFTYRFMPDPPLSHCVLAEFYGGIFWWWFFWHMWHDFGHIVGEFPYPDPSSWTDEELGIPSEEEMALLLK